LSLSPLLLFLLFAIGLWLLVTLLTGALSGWFKLVSLYPDRPEEPVLRLRGQSGAMGPGVWFRGVLRLSACRSGLRVGMNRALGPFCRDFFVPWESIAVSRRNGLFGTLAELQFGAPAVGRLSISANAANRLARAVERWHGAGPLSEIPDHDPVNLFRICAVAGGVLAAVLFVGLMLVGRS